MSPDQGIILDIEDKPRLRLNLQIIPAQVSNEKVLVFQDPERWSEEMVILPAQLAPLLQYFDGNHSLREIQEEIMQQTRQLIAVDDLQQLEKELDDHLLLDSERFRNYVQAQMKEWVESKVRPPVLAGQSYPEDPEALKKFLDDFYISGPGMPSENKGDQLKAILAPHIELQGNGQVYASAYKKLLEESQAELFLILGTGHHPMEDIMVFSEKDFQTPLGIAETDREFIRAVKKRMRKKSRLGDFSHRKEHSIELQVLFLQHLLQGKRKFKIVPILIGSCQSMVELGYSPDQDLLVQDYLVAIREQIKAEGKKVALIASVDLAHLGPRYGDRESYTPIREEEIKADDQKMLCCLEQCDAEGFFREIARTKDRRKICGLAPIYFTFKIIEPTRAELLKWSVWYDQNSKSAVSFCAMALS